MKFAERNFFVPVPLIADLNELNKQLKAHCESYLEHTQARQSQTVGERLHIEQPALLAIPEYQPECCRIISLKADRVLNLDPL